jgi:ribosomal protein L31
MGKMGDAVVDISINSHRFFTRQGDDIHIDPSFSTHPFRKFHLALGSCSEGESGHHSK